MPKTTSLCVCICTYRRHELVELLIDDLQRQNLSLPSLIVVDGDPASQEVLRMLQRRNPESFGSLWYVPSNHANLAYQRYLGWRVARSVGARLLIYLDDDLRLLREDTILRAISPLQEHERRVVGCTAETNAAAEKIDASTEILAERDRRPGRKMTFLVGCLGASRGLPPGSLSPAGNRVPFDKEPGEYASVDCLRGRVMAYRMEAVTENCFPEDLFALCEIKCGLGEDTIISRRVRSRGTFLCLRGDYFYHPSTALPNSYPIHAFELGYATAYSRRLVNDNYRWPSGARLSDRWHLIKSYCGNFMLNWFRAALRPRAYRFAYAWGYTLGALNGVFLPPRSSRLTPGIDWAADAQRALSESKEVNEAVLENVN